MLRGFILFFIVFLGVGSLQAQNCSELIGTCEYYQCIENTEQCGSKGYYLEFGKHYCEKYKANQSKYTYQGEAFLDNIRNCLQDELERERERSGQLPSCGQIKKFAIETHKTCYRQYDFCGLSTSDSVRIKLTATKELFDPQMFKFAFWLEKSCF
jgi:hypothetical protein